MANEPVVRVEGLRRSYGDRRAVDSVSFSIMQGEVNGILGPNGAGKTTTVEMLEGMRAPDGGSAWVAGFDVVRDPERVKAAIGVQLQEGAFFDNLSLAELLNLFAALYHRSVDPRGLLVRVGLADRPPRACSGGTEAPLRAEATPPRRYPPVARGALQPLDTPFRDVIFFTESLAAGPHGAGDPEMGLQERHGPGPSTQL